MMLEEQLRKNVILNFAGGYSVKKNSRTIIESLNYTAELLQKKDNLVLMFPQGFMQSIYNSEFVFEKGIEKILQKVSNQIQVVLLANLIEYFEDPKPKLYSYLIDFNGDYTTKTLQTKYNEFYKQCIENHKKKKI
jgi:hypothetical protein